ncbi:iron(III) dicitrate transport ATP-binding protein [Ketogulonicigenium robustum]|uniref:Iron(III) dicitrate transport ATP-binding protein n=1 Tax=Ketogulonicigenium robustum TaxID=92947 RepID=A0A1W6P042_9RHOB|nr:ATP-binding cassette domain-containing protein [Ketogulonicigenium robustum]ARO14886.1 iron(III) dicitrate transport ATP-binding protein [Ketogulonicigenium robustum]
MTIAIEMKNLSLRYGATPVLEGLNLHIPTGKFTVLVGQNGCGKSSLLKALIRALPLAGGDILLGGTALAQIPPRRLAQMMSLLPQTLNAPDGVTVRQLVTYGRSPHTNLWNRLGGSDRAVVDGAMIRMNIAPFADRPVAELSGGQRQRAWLAMVLAQQTPIILLDEPTSYLDIAHQVEVLRLCRDLADEGRTVVAVLHDLNQAFRYADQVILLQNGKCMAAGAPPDVAREDLLHAAFDIRARIVTDPEAHTPMMIVRK